MSMIASFLRVSQEELDSYLNNSALLEERFYDDEREDEDPYLLDIDKAWDGILYLLTGNGSQYIDMPDPSGFQAVIFSGQLIDRNQDLGYGPAHYLTPNQVKSMNNALSKKSREDLLDKFDPADMTNKDIYPGIWDEENNEVFDYLYLYFELLQQFYEEASNENQAVIAILS